MRNALTLLPLPLNTTLDPRAETSREFSQKAFNMRLDRGAFEAGLRQRTFSAAHSSFASSGSQGLGLALYGSDSYMFGMNNNSLGACDADNTFLAGTMSRWDTSAVTLPTGITYTGRWSFWRHKTLVLAAGGASGSVIVIDPGAANSHSASLLYDDYDLDSAGTAGMFAPPYNVFGIHATATATATFTWSGTHSGSVANVTVDNENWVEVQDSVDPSGYVDVLHTLVADWLDGEAVDWSRVDSLTFKLEKYRPFDEGVHNWGGNFSNGATLNESSGWTFMVQTWDGVSAYTDHYCPVTLRLTTETRGGENYLQLQVYADLSGVARTDRTRVVGFKVSAVIRKNGPEGLRMSPLTLGGTYLIADDAADDIADVDTSSLLGNVNYAYTFYEAGPGESNAIAVNIAELVTLGDRAFANLPYLGGVVGIAVEPNTSPYTTAAQIRLYRKQTGGDWAEVTNSGLTGGPSRGTNQVDPVTDEWPVVKDNLRQHEVDGLTGVSLTISGTVDPLSTDAVTNVTCGASWKGSCVYGSRTGRVYFSDPADYRRVLWPSASVGTLLGDETDPRTVTLSRDESPITGIIAGDALYAFTRAGAYAFVGQFAATAVGPILLDVAGCLNTRACAEYRGGCVYCSDDGVYLLAMPPNSQGVSAEPQIVELTKNMRASYQGLVGTDYDDVVLVTNLGELWVLNGSDFMHLDKDGNWTTGTWADGCVVTDAVAHPYYGVVFLDDDGKLRVTGEFETDGATAVEGTGGSAYTWEYRTSTTNTPSRALRAKAYFNSGTVTVAVSSAKGSGSVALTTSDDYQSLPRITSGGAAIGGDYWDVQISAPSTTKVYKVEMELSGASAESGT